LKHDGNVLLSGLGKTFQTICLIWTLLKSGPTGSPGCKKAIIVCPATLVKNWKAEFNKWLGSHRLNPIAMAAGGQSGKELMNDFINAPTRPVLIVGYDLIRRFTKQLQGMKNTAKTILICDEGHRLKNSNGNATIKSLLSLQCTMKVILSGTPVQNNLMEFYSMCDFVRFPIQNSDFAQQLAATGNSKRCNACTQFINAHF
jgi:DNA repair and recombination protein RAD54B